MIARRQRQMCIRDRLAVDKDKPITMRGEVYEYRRTPIARDILKILENMSDGNSGRAPEMLDLLVP